MLKRLLLCGALALSPAVADAASEGQSVIGYWANAPQTNCKVGPCFIPYGATLPVSGGGGGSSTLPVGAASLSTSQASVGNTATSIVAARTGAAGTGRVAVTICDFGTTAVFVGPANTVTASTGAYIGPNGACLTLNTTSAVFGITASGTDSVSAAETF